MSSFEFIHWNDPTARKRAKVHTGKHNRRLWKGPHSQRPASDAKGGHVVAHKSVACPPFLTTTNESRLEEPSRPRSPYLKLVLNDCDDSVTAGQRLVPGDDDCDESVTTGQRLVPDDDDDDAPVTSSEITDVSFKHPVQGKQISKQPLQYLRLPGPFYNLIAGLEEGLQYAVQWYVFDAPVRIWRSSASSHFHHIRDWYFKIIVNGPLGIQSSNYFSLVHHHLSQCQQPSSLLLRERGRLLSDFSKALEHPAECISDDMLTGLAHFICSEQRMGSMFHWQAHYAGYMQLLDIRGGFETLGSNLPLAEMITWSEVAIICPVESMNAQTSSTMKILNAKTLEGRPAFEELLVGLRLLTLDQFESQITRMLRDPALKRAFCTPMIRAAGNGARLNAVSERLNRNARVACLLYVNHMLCIHRASPDSALAFLSRLMKVVSQPFGPNSSPWLWVLIREIEEDDISQLWWLLRMLRIFHRLRAETATLLHEVLLDTLLCWKEEQVQTQIVKADNLWMMVQEDLERLVI